MIAAVARSTSPSLARPARSRPNAGARRPTAPWPSSKRSPRERDRMQAEVDRGRGAAPQRRAEDRAAALGLARPADAADLDHRRRRGARLADADRGGAGRAERGDRRRGRAALAPGREPARHLAAGGGQGRAAPRAGRPRRGPGGGARRRSRARRRGSGFAIDADLPMVERRRRPARARVREPARERGPPRRRQAGLGRLRAGRGRGSSSASSTRGPGIPEARVGAHLRALLPRPHGGARPAPGSASRSPRGSSRPTAATIAIESLPGQGTSFVVSFAGTARRRAVERGDRGSSSATTSRRSSAR